MSNALREVLAKFGFEVDTKNLKDADKKTDNYVDKLKGLAGIIGGGYLLGRMKDFVSELRDTAGELRSNAQKTGMSVQAWQQWQTAAKFAGVSSEALANGIKFLQKNSVEAAKGGGDAATEFKALGVEVKDASGEVRASGPLLRDTAIGISKIQNPAKKTAAVLKLFGRAGTDLIPFFNKGADGITDLLGKLDEFGGGLDDDAIDKLGKSGRASKEFDLALLSLKGRLASQLLPTLTNFVKWSTKMVLGFLKLAKGSSAFQAALIILGRIAIAAAIKMYAAYLPMILGFAALVLIIDDLITAFKGGDSVITRTLNALNPNILKGIKKVFGGIKDSFLDVVYTIDQSDNLGDKVEAFFLNVGGKIGDEGENISEAWRYLWKDLNDSANTGGTTLVDYLGAKFKGIADGALRLVVDLGNSATDAANALIDGLVNGLLAGADKVIDSVYEVGSKIKKAVKGVFETNSPSKFTTNEAFMLDMGIVKGLAKGVPAIQKQADQTYVEALPDYSPAFRPSKGGSGGGATQIDQRNEININIDGSQDSRGIAADVRDGVKTAMNDNRNEMIYDLETVAAS